MMYLAVLVLVLIYLAVPVLVLITAVWACVKLSRPGHLTLPRRSDARLKGMLTLDEPAPRGETDGAGPGDLTEHAYTLEPVHATTLRLLREHGALPSDELFDLIDDTPERWHMVVMTTAGARVAYPDFLSHWQETLERLVELSGCDEGVGYLTLDEAVVEPDTTHRRSGLHVDGIGPEGAGGWGKAGMLLGQGRHLTRTLFCGSFGFLHGDHGR